MASPVHHLEIGQAGQANNLLVGDYFVRVDDPNGKPKQVTNDLGSHFEFDGRVNKKLSKDTMVRRVGEAADGELALRASETFRAAVQALELNGDVQQWSVMMSDVLSRAVSAGLEDVLLPLEKLEKQGSAVFAKARRSHDQAAAASLTPAVRKRWVADVRDVATRMEAPMAEAFRHFVRSTLSG